METLLFLSLMVPGTFLCGLQDVFIKKYLKEGLDEQLLLGISWLLGGLMLASVFLFVRLPEIKTGFWPAMVSTVILNLVSQNIFMRAFKASEASLIAPLRLITPPLVILTGFLILGERASLAGIFGIFVTMFGLFWLFYSEGGATPAKLKKLLRDEKGFGLGLAGSALFAVSFPFDKKTVVTSSGLFAAVVALILVGFFTLLGNFIFNKNFRSWGLSRAKHWRKALFLVSFLGAVASVLTNQSLNYSLAAYSASVKRLWSFWTILLAGRFLQEKNIGSRLFASAVMLLGIALTLVLG